MIIRETVRRGSLDCGGRVGQFEWVPPAEVHGPSKGVKSTPKIEPPKRGTWFQQQVVTRPAGKMTCPHAT